jgi:ELWxxDGT repeat protein
MVVNIDSETSSWPFALINFNGILYFTAYTEEYGRELWKTDGTEENTEQVIDINAGNEDAFYIHSFCINENELFFCATNGENGYELWKTDGTESGSVIIKDINSGNESSEPKKLIKIGDNIYFQAFEPIHGSELWKTDGTESGTVLVADILPGNLSSSPSNIILVDNEILFIAESIDFGRQIWRIPNNTNQIEELINNIQLSIYPNPTYGKINIETNERVENISVLNISGKEILKTIKTEIDLTNYENGTYILKIETENGLINKTIIKE